VFGFGCKADLVITKRDFRFRPYADLANTGYLMSTLERAGAHLIHKAGLTHADHSVRMDQSTVILHRALMKVPSPGQMRQRPGLFIGRAIAASVLPADWPPGLSYPQARFSWPYSWSYRSSILLSSLEQSAQRQEADHSEREPLTLAARLSVQRWLRPLPQAKAAFGAI
jgi:hypothetical protein